MGQGDLFKLHVLKEGFPLVNLMVHLKRLLRKYIGVVNNTFWTNTTFYGEGLTKNASGSIGEVFKLRNNIIRAHRYAFQATAGTAQTGGRDQWDENYNWVGTSGGGAAAIKYSTTGYNTIAAYRTATTGTYGNNSNIAGGADFDFTSVVEIDAVLTDEANGDLTLISGANNAVGIGLWIPNVADTFNASPTLWNEFDGDAPDLGYRERALA